MFVVTLHFAVKERPLELTVLTVLSRRPRWALALSHHWVTRGTGAVARMYAAWAKPSLWTV